MDGIESEIEQEYIYASPIPRFGLTTEHILIVISDTYNDTYESPSLMTKFKDQQGQQYYAFARS